MKKQKLYISLYEQLKNQIIEGQYQAQDKFPSKRQLSEHLSLSHTTIEHAYQLLLDEGFIYSKPRSGYYVSDIQSLPVININNQFIETEPKTPESKQYKYAFNLAEIDAEYFPLNLFRKYAKEAFEDNELALLEKGDIQGELNLRQQIAHYLFNSRGVSCHPNQIVIGSSTEQLLNMITELLKTSSFIIEKPSYPPIKHVLDKNKHNYIQATVEKDGINMIDIINSNNDIVYITPSHQFPTGYVMNLKKRTQLIKWAHQQNSRYIIEDDYDSEFRYYGKPIPALQSVDKNDRVIDISTFSKSLYPSCRIAYIVLPQKLLQSYLSMPYKESNTVPVHIQQIIANFMSSGSFERHLNKMRKIYREKLNYILERLKPHEDQLKIEGALTGMHFTITVDNGLTMSQCLHNAEKLKLKLNVYNYAEENELLPKFIIGFGGIPNHKLKAHTDVLIKSLTV